MKPVRRVKWRNISACKSARIVAGVRQPLVDTPITEQGLQDLASVRLAGPKPSSNSTFNFAMQAIDQIINPRARRCACRAGDGASVVFRQSQGAAARVGAQHSQDYSSWYCTFY
jgi:pyruvate dehydrogenase E1 component beta subunit